MKILVTGITGMLGKSIVKELAQRSNIEIIGISKSAHAQDLTYKIYNLDLTDLPRVREVAKEINPQVVIHCAANVNIEDCENNKLNTELLHIKATGELAKVCKSSKFIYISTDSVFDGEKGNFSENDIPYPLNYYALTKLKGEEAALSANNNTIVVRTNIYGFSLPLKNSLLEWAIKNLKKGITIAGFNDVFFNPLYTGQLAKLLVLLIESRYSGIVHLASKKHISKLAFLRLLAEEFGFENANIQSKSIQDFPHLIARPKNSTLSTTLFEKLFIPAPDLRVGLRSCYEDFLQEYNNKKHYENN